VSDPPFAFSRVFTILSVESNSVSLSTLPEQVSSWLKGRQAAKIFVPKPERQSSWSVARSARHDLLWLLWAIAIASLLILLMLVFNTLP
jgi:hypothetical protein